MCRLSQSHCEEETPQREPGEGLPSGVVGVFLLDWQAGVHLISWDHHFPWVDLTLWTSYFVCSTEIMTVWLTVLNLNEQKSIMLPSGCCQKYQKYKLSVNEWYYKETNQMGQLVISVFQYIYFMSDIIIHMVSTTDWCVSCWVCLVKNPICITSWYSIFKIRFSFFL